MHKGITSLLVAGMLLIAGASTAGELNVVVTLPEIGALAGEIGGDRIKVTTLAGGDEDPHVLPAKPSHSRRMLHADLLVYNGLELEVGWLPVLIRGARNPDIRQGRPGNLDLSRVVHPLEIPTGGADRSAGDVHPEGNPHYTVDPRIYPTLASELAGRLSQLDPDGADYYQNRLEEFISKWGTLSASWAERVAFLDGQKVITYHQQWEYLSEAFAFRILDKIENRPGIPPTPRHLAELEDSIRTRGIRLILYSDLVHPELPEKLAGRAGCRALALPQSVGSREGTDDLAAWFETMVRAFEKAFESEAQ